MYAHVYPSIGLSDIIRSVVSPGREIPVKGSGPVSHLPFFGPFTPDPDKFYRLKVP